MKELKVDNWLKRGDQDFSAVESGEGIESRRASEGARPACGWNPVKELKDAGEQIGYVHSFVEWNPVKELKVDHILEKLETLVQWNPVKELKEHQH